MIFSSWFVQSFAVFPQLAYARTDNNHTSLIVYDLNNMFSDVSFGFLDLFLWNGSNQESISPSNFILFFLLLFFLFVFLVAFKLTLNDLMWLGCFYPYRQLLGWVLGDSDISELSRPGIRIRSSIPVMTRPNPLDLGRDFEPYFHIWCLYI